MRIIMSGGGTGGHIYPAMTIFQAIQKLNTQCEVLFVGTEQGLEADIIPKAGYPFANIEIQGFERRLSWRNIRTAVNVFGSLWESRRLIAKFKPDLVIGTGGYVCGPVLLTAALMGIPAMIQEQNVIPGITNKILARFVKKVALGYEEALPYFGGVDRGKLVFTGNPIRDEVTSVEREEGAAALGLDAGKKTVLISGGSRGARSINRAMLAVHRHFAGKKAVQLLHVTGQSEYNDMVGNFKQSGIDIHEGGNIIIRPYLYNMPQALAAADVAVFRAGAIGLAELTARGIPAVLVPYPYAAENHQEYNARAMERHGAAMVIRDAELEGEQLAGVIDELVSHPGKLNDMAAACKRLGRPHAADEIAKLALAMQG